RPPHTYHQYASGGRRGQRQPVHSPGYAPSLRPPALPADLARAVGQVLKLAELAQADRAASVQLLRRVADLGPHAELAAVGEAGRGVDVDAGRVDAELECPRRVDRARDDGLGMAGAVLADVVDRLVDRVDDFDGEDQGEELGCAVLIGGGRHAGVEGAHAVVPAQLDAALAQRGERAGQE